MLGMTEAGSVCLMDPDESDQPEHRRGSFGRPVPELEARVVDPETLAERRHRRAGRAVAAGPAAHGGLLRPRALDDVHPRRVVPHRRRSSRRDERGLLLLRRAARRHDQDRWRERVAARGRGRAARRHGRSRCRSCSASPTPSAARSSPQSSSPTPTLPLDIDALRDALAGAPLRVQGAAPDRAVRAGRSCPCCRAASPTCAALVEVVGERAERLTVPALIARWAAEQPDAAVPRRRRRDAHLRRARPRDARRRPARLAARRRREGDPRRRPDAEQRGAGRSPPSPWRGSARVVVPLSTLLRPPELEAQLRVGGRRAPARRAGVPRAPLPRRPPRDLARARPAIRPAVRAARCRACASIDVWPDDCVDRRRAPRARRPGARRRARARGAAGRRPRHRVHVGEPRHAEGRDPHARWRARRDRGGPRRCAA